MVVTLVALTCTVPGPAVGKDAVCAVAVRRDWPGGIHVDAAAAGLRKDADAVPAYGRNARTGVSHKDWRIRTAIIGSNTDRSVGGIGGRRSGTRDMSMPRSQLTCSARWPCRRKDINSRPAKLRAAHVDDGAGLGGDRSRPVVSPREDATGPDCAHVERAAIVCHGRIAGPQPRNNGSPA